MTVANDGAAVPWTPPSLDAWWLEPFPPIAEWSYVYIEEVAGAVAEFHRWRWPHVDQVGRLGWLPEHGDLVRSAAVAVPLLFEELYAPNDVQRTPRAGDVFAAPHVGEALIPSFDEAGNEQPAEAVTYMRQLFPSTIFDITADAREAAKVSYLSASARIASGTEEFEALRPDEVGRAEADAFRLAPRLEPREPNATDPDHERSD